VGIAYGTVGLTALTVGGLAGGWVISRIGLKRALWPLVLAMHVPNVIFVALAMAQPGNLWLVSAGLAVEQFGYGLGFTAYLVYMILVAEGPHKTAHYAICTGFMALGMMLPGMWSGWLQDQLGYLHFFLWVLVATVPSLVMTALIRVPEDFGRKQPDPPAT
jgi:PAT family beta-lactamase induction signal transducer AmpG